MDKTAKISVNRQKKMQLVDEMSAKVAKAKGMVFTDYTGLTHQQLEGIKRAVKKLDGEFVVTKNTLLKRTLSALPVIASETKQSTTNQEIAASPSAPRNDVHSEIFNHPTATLFAYADLIEPLKVLARSIKEINLPIYKAGIIEGQLLSAQDVDTLSTLPAKPVLQAQLLGMMKSPIQNLHRALSWNMQSLVITLSAIAKQKQTS